MRVARLLPLLPVLAGVACGSGGGSGPLGPSGTPAPTPTPQGPTHSVTAFVFYDENGNGAPDSDEPIRLRGVTVTLEGQSGTTDANGDVVVNGVPDGSREVSVDEASMPPYFVQAMRPTIQVPQASGSSAPVPVTLPIGRNRPEVYMAFGDSITEGDGSSSGLGYRGFLRDDLDGYWGGRADVPSEAEAGSKSDQGVERLGDSLNRVRPAYTLILYGTNDWSRGACRDAFPCFTIDSLRSMIGQCHGFGSLPVVGTIPPVNPAYVDRDAAERNDWVDRMNALIRPMVQEQGAVLAEVHDLFLQQPSLEALFSDHVHPNDDGYRLIAQAFFQAITSPASRPGASFQRIAPAFGFSRPGPTSGPRQGASRPPRPGR